MVKRISRYLQDKGRTMIGWDEILEGGLPDSAVVMSWRGMKGGIKAASLKHYVIMSPDSYVYLDHYQGDKKYEPKAIGGYSPLKHVYDFDPVPERMPIKDQKYILGGQANVWTEYIPNENHLQYMIFPRILAVSEVLWTEKEKRNWKNFSARVKSMFSYFDAQGINYAKSAFNLRSEKLINPNTGDLEVNIFNEFISTEIRYTLDGTTPDKNSLRYKSPLIINKSTRIKAQAFDNGKKVGKPYVEDINLVQNKAKGAKVDYSVKYSGKYAAGKDFGLVDGITGSIEFDDHRWQGWFNEPVELTIDLGSIKKINSISVGFLADRGNQILIPGKVSVAVSNNNETFDREKIFNNPETLTKKKFKKYLDAKFNKKARYIKIKVANASNIITGEKGWTFIDEILVN